MSALLPARDSLANRISYYHLLLLMASLPFDRFYSHVILISFAVHTLIQLNTGRVKSIFAWRTLLLQSVFVVTVISTIYTAYSPQAYAEWGKQITILLLPLLFCLTGLDIKRYRASLMLGFALVCTATVIYLYWDALRTIRFYKMPYPAIFSAAFTNHNFSEPIDMHATFFSMQLLIALAYLVSLLLKERSVLLKIAYTLCICILAAGLLQLCSKTVCFCLLLVINLVLPFFLLEGHRRWKFMLSAGAISLILLISVFRLGAFKERYVTELRIDLTTKTASQTTEPRLARWGAAGGLIAQSPIIGHGAGSEIGLLHGVYYQKKYYSSFLNRLNVHNQYLSFLLKSGVIGLLAYLATLVFGFKIALAKKDLLFFSFMLLIALVSLAENFLDVDKGILFYALFFSFFVFSNEDRAQETGKANHSAFEPASA